MTILVVYLRVLGRPLGLETSLDAQRLEFRQRGDGEPSLAAEVSSLAHVCVCKEEQGLTG